MTDIPHFIFGILGNAFAAFLFLAPTITFRRIIKNKSTEEFSGVPYPMTLLNCLLSAWYGLPFVSKDNLLVTTINGTGAAIEIIYVIIFLVFAPKKQKAKIGGIFAAVLSVFAAVSLISYFALHGNTRKLFCGTAATVFSIIMYASPLSIMDYFPPDNQEQIDGGILRRAVPMTLLNCLLSAWYGLPFVSKDNLLVTTINGTGAAIEIIYVIIFLVFAPKKQKAKIGGIFAAVLSVFAAVSLISYFALHGNTRKLFCGTAETVFSIIMYASPLSIMRLVIKTKSVEFMPFFTLRLPMRHFLVHLWPTRSRPFHSSFPVVSEAEERLVIKTKSVEFMPLFLSLFIFLCGTSWFIYGLLGRDPFIAVSVDLTSSNHLIFIIIL
ncbi:Bidirectional sugar transporter SWEET1 [Linum perenne]